MSIAIRKGHTLDVRTKKTGTSRQGQFWCMFVARDETNAQNKDRITVFADNPEEAQWYTKARIGNITEVFKSNQKVGDQWRTSVVIHAHVDGMNETAVRDREAYASFAEAVQGSESPSDDDRMDFTKAADFGEDGSLPFN